jgi:hypothetical protein
MPPTEESYRQLADDLARAQQKIAQLQAAQQTETEMQHRANCLQAINELAQKLAATTPPQIYLPSLPKRSKQLPALWGLASPVTGPTPASWKLNMWRLPTNRTFRNSINCSQNF